MAVAVSIRCNDNEGHRNVGGPIVRLLAEAVDLDDNVDRGSSGCMQELEQLRTAAQALKADVDLLQANQESQRKQEETVLLGQLRKTVQALQAESSAISDQQHAVRLVPRPYSCKHHNLVAAAVRAATPAAAFAASRGWHGHGSSLTIPASHGLHCCCYGCTQ